MKKIAYYILLCIIITSFKPRESSIQWNEAHRLSWKDFKGIPDHSSDAAAITASGITYNLTAIMKNNIVEVDCKVSTHFYPERSWYKKEQADSVVLAHEQLHFDITELYARKLKNAIDATVFTAHVKAQINTLYDTVNQELDAFQNAYDNDTEYSRNYEKQREWGIKIKKALQTTR